LRQVHRVGPREHTQRDIDHLQITAAGHRLDHPWLCSHIIQNRAHEPRHNDVRALLSDALLDAAKAMEHDCAVTTLDVDQAAASAICDACKADRTHTRCTRCSRTGHRANGAREALKGFTQTVHDV